MTSFTSVSGTSIDFPYSVRQNVSIKHLNEIYNAGFGFSFNRIEIKSTSGNYIEIQGVIGSDKISIKLYEDEWFLVVISTWHSDYFFYKCDQIEGVIDCLKQIYRL